MERGHGSMGVDSFSVRGSAMCSEPGMAGMAVTGFAHAETDDRRSAGKPLRRRAHRLWTPSPGPALRLAVVVSAVFLSACASRVSLDEPTLPPPPLPPLVAPLSDEARAAAGAASAAEAASAAQASASAPLPADEVASAAASSVRIESPAVAERFPEPAVRYRTPAFEPDHPGYTSNAEMRSLLLGMIRNGDGRPGSTSVRLVQVGSSQSGAPIEVLHFSRTPTSLAGTGATATPPRTTVMLIGQQHGNEPAGAEALLVIAQQLSNGRLASLLDRIDVVVLPRANPDGAAVDRRDTDNGIDLNRDHLLLRTPEAQAIAKAMVEFEPSVVVDAHEFAAIGPYLQKFGTVQRYDALTQYAITANLPEFVTRASEEWFRQPMQQALGAQGLTSQWYYTTSADPDDRRVSMGGVQPDNERNVGGLRNAVSLLVESRGADLGRAHLLRRVFTQVTAISSILRSTSTRADDLAKLRRFVEADLAAKACQGDVVVEATTTPSEFDLTMLNPQTGADQSLNVSWESALELTTVKQRPRPCGYWLGADQTDAALRLRALGLQVQRLEESGSMRGESYVETERATGARVDGRGTISDAAAAVRVKVNLVPALIDVRAGSYYVGLDQPLANLAVAALEPDTQSSLFANGIVTALNSTARVLMRPETRMTPMQ